MDDTPKTDRPAHWVRSLIRGVSLACAVIGFFLGLVWSIVDLVGGRHALDSMPNWLGCTLLFFIVCYGFWEIKLNLGDPPASSRPPQR